MKKVQNVAIAKKRTTYLAPFNPIKFFNTDNKLDVLAKYKCRVNNKRCQLILSKDYLVVEDKNNTYKLSCTDMSKITLAEKLWAIRVNLYCNKHIYRFDFPSFRVATKFYEQLIYSKVKAHVH